MMLHAAMIALENLPRLVEAEQEANTCEDVGDVIGWLRAMRRVMAYSCPGYRPAEIPVSDGFYRKIVKHKEDAGGLPWSGESGVVLQGVPVVPVVDLVCAENEDVNR